MRILDSSKICEPIIPIVLEYNNRCFNDPIFRAHDNALKNLFMRLCPSNNNLNDVLIKVSTLNDFYSTYIYDTYQLACHIVNDINDIDIRLHLGDLTLVDEIANVNFITSNKRHAIYPNQNYIIPLGETQKKMRLYSFASKYCSFHNPAKFPIYDSYVEAVLYELKQKGFFDRKDFTKKGLKNYRIFVDVIEKLKNKFKPFHFSYKEIDRYLWRLGKDSVLYN